MSGQVGENGKVRSSIQMQSAENRQHVRVSLNTPGLVRKPESDAWLSCTVVNVSNGGVQLAFKGTDESGQLHPLDRLCVRFRIGTEYLLDASVVWEGLYDRQYKAGMEWVHPTDPQLERLRVELMRVAVQRRRRR